MNPGFRVQGFLAVSRLGSRLDTAVIFIIWMYKALYYGSPIIDCVVEYGGSTQVQGFIA